MARKGEKNSAGWNNNRKASLSSREPTYTDTYAHWKTRGFIFACVAGGGLRHWIGEEKEKLIKREAPINFVLLSRWEGGCAVHWRTWDLKILLFFVLFWMRQLTFPPIHCQTHEEEEPSLCFYWIRLVGTLACLESGVQTQRKKEMSVDCLICQGKNPTLSEEIYYVRCN